MSVPGGGGGPSMDQYQSLLIGGGLLALSALVCYAFLRCARHRAREAYAQEMADIQEARDEIDRRAAEEGRAGGGRPSSAGAATPTGLKPALLARLPTFAYTDPPKATAAGGSSGDAAAGAAGNDGPAAPSEERSCIICLGNLAEERCLTVPCGHIFHAACVLPWLADKGTCPECRLDVGEMLDPQRVKKARGKGGG